MKELEKYLQELSQDVTEMVQKANSRRKTNVTAENFFTSLQK